MNNREFGNKGEDLACEYLVKNGYEILERNKHFSKLCEIDIIAKFKNKVVFVEVKTRKSDAFGTPMEAITKTKYNNRFLYIFIASVASVFLLNKKTTNLLYTYNPRK